MMAPRPQSAADADDQEHDHHHEHEHDAPTPPTPTTPTTSTTPPTPLQTSTSHTSSTATSAAPPAASSSPSTDSPIGRVHGDAAWSMTDTDPEAHERREKNAGRAEHEHEAPDVPSTDGGGHDTDAFEAPPATLLYERLADHHAREKDTPPHEGERDATSTPIRAASTAAAAATTTTSSSSSSSSSHPLTTTSPTNTIVSREPPPSPRQDDDAPGGASTMLPSEACDDVESFVANTTDVLATLCSRLLEIQHDEDRFLLHVHHLDGTRLPSHPPQTTTTPLTRWHHETTAPALRITPAQQQRLEAYLVEFRLLQHRIHSFIVQYASLDATSPPPPPPPPPTTTTEPPLAESSPSQDLVAIDSDTPSDSPTMPAASSSTLLDTHHEDTKERQLRLLTDLHDRISREACDFEQLLETLGIATAHLSLEAVVANNSAATTSTTTTAATTSSLAAAASASGTGGAVILENSDSDDDDRGHLRHGLSSSTLGRSITGSSSGAIGTSLKECRICGELLPFSSFYRLSCHTFCREVRTWLSSRCCLSLSLSRVDLNH